MAKPVENKEDKNPNKIEMSPSLMMLISNGVVLIIILIALFVMYMLIESSMNKKIEQLANPDEQTQLEDEEEARQEGILLDLGSDIYNLADINAKVFLRANVALEISKTQEEIDAAIAIQNAKPSGGHGHGSAPAVDPNAEIAAAMERYKPSIKDAIISVLSGKTSDELSTPTGKEIAKEEIREAINNIFEGQREVMRVSFGQFIIDHK